MTIISNEPSSSNESAKLLLVVVELVPVLESTFICAERNACEDGLASGWDSVMWTERCRAREAEGAAAEDLEVRTRGLGGMGSLWAIGRGEEESSVRMWDSTFGMDITGGDRESFVIRIKLTVLLWRKWRVAEEGKN